MPQFMDDLKNFHSSTTLIDRSVFYLTAAAFFFLPTGTAPPLICIIPALGILVLSGRIFTIRTKIHPPWIWPLVLMIMLPWAGLLYVPEITDVGIDYARKSHYWLYALVVALIPGHKAVIPFIARAFLAGLFINTLLALMQYGGLVTPPSPSGIQGYFGFGVIYSALSIYLVAGILTASLFFRQTSGPGPKTACLILMALFLFHISIMDGRNGYLTFILVSPMVAANLVGMLHWKRQVAVCTLFIVFMSFSPVLQNRIAETVS
ncbi:MAG: hypothetical protein HQK66_13625, partial [Desulfamplus sp.]|nr:hypothetical protein [Desulfamplus sp.]